MTRRYPATWRDVPARRYGAPRSEGRRRHAGIDLGRAGDAVVAPEDGYVDATAVASYGDDVPRWSTPAGWSGYGPGVVIFRGESGFWHILGHVAIGPNAIIGRRYRAGDVIATVHPRGGHVHWEVRRRRQPPAGTPTYDITVDPHAWVRGDPPPAPGSVPGAKANEGSHG